MNTLASEFDLWLDQLGQRRLESELGAIEARLGTPAEYPDDLECARAIFSSLNYRRGDYQLAPRDEAIWARPQDQPRGTGRASTG
jgi:hypothetical protein